MRRMLLAATIAALAACATQQRAGRNAAACDALDPTACHRVALRALVGDGTARDDRRAASALLVSCERRNPQACVDLGALYAAGRGVRLDPRRACDLGAADACARLGRATAGPAWPLSAQVAAALALPAQVEAGPARSLDAAHGRRTVEAAGLFIAPEVRERIGLTEAAVDDPGFAPPADAALFEPLVRMRLPALAGCFPVALLPDGNRLATQGALTLAVSADGRAARVRVGVDGVLPGPEEAEAARCAERLVAGWEFPIPHAPGRLVWTMVTGAGREVPAAPRLASGPDPDAPAPSYATAGYRKPELARGGCIEAVVTPRMGGLPEPARRAMIVKFAVGGGGRVSRFSVLALPTDRQDVNVDLALEVKRAVESCRWIPGTDPAGRPASIWVILPVKFVP